MAYAALGANDQAIGDLQTAADLYASQGDAENQGRAQEAIRILQALPAPDNSDSGDGTSGSAVLGLLG